MRACTIRHNRPFLERRRVLAIAVCLLVCGGPSAQAEEDPLEWPSTTQSPEFRKVLSDSDYQRLSDPFLKRLPQAQREAASKFPDHGLRLSGVFAPGELESRGVGLSDVITKVEGEELWGRWLENRREPVRLQVYSARQNSLREIKAETNLAYAFSVHRRPDLPYLRSKLRNSAWDREAFVGLVAADSAPDVAETAWHRALAAGCARSRRCLASGTQLALAQGRPETALAFWREAEQAPGPEPLDPLLGYRVLIANYKWEQARTLARKYPHVFHNLPAGAEALIAIHRTRSAQDRAATSPSVQARKMHRRDARGDLVGISQLTENMFLDLVTRREEFHAGPASNHFSLVELSHPRGLANFELTFALTMAPTDTQRANFVKLVRLTAMGGRKLEDRENSESSFIGHVELEVPSGFSLRASETDELVYFPDPLVASDGKTVNRIRLLRVRGLLEVFVNERRVLYQPIDPELLLRQIHFQAVGTTIDISEFSLLELVPRL